MIDQATAPKFPRTVIIDDDQWERLKRSWKKDWPALVDDSRADIEMGASFIALYEKDFSNASSINKHVDETAALVKKLQIKLGELKNMSYDYFAISVVLFDWSPETPLKKRQEKNERHSRLRDLRLPPESEFDPPPPAIDQAIVSLARLQNELDRFKLPPQSTKKTARVPWLFLIVRYFDLLLSQKNGKPLNRGDRSISFIKGMLEASVRKKVEKEDIANAIRRVDETLASAVRRLDETDIVNEIRRVDEPVSNAIRRVNESDIANAIRHVQDWPKEDFGAFQSDLHVIVNRTMTDDAFGGLPSSFFADDEENLKRMKR